MFLLWGKRRLVVFSPRGESVFGCSFCLVKEHIACFFSLGGGAAFGFFCPGNGISFGCVGCWKNVRFVFVGWRSGFCFCFRQARGGLLCVFIFGGKRRSVCVYQIRQVGAQSSFVMYSSTSRYQVPQEDLNPFVEGILKIPRSQESGEWGRGWPSPPLKGGCSPKAPLLIKNYHFGTQPVWIDRSVCFC